MATCVHDDGSGYLKIDDVQTPDSCTEYLLLNSSEFADLQAISTANMMEVLTQLFSFDLDVFVYIQVMIIVTFITGHGIGRVVKILNKV